MKPRRFNLILAANTALLANATESGMPFAIQQEDGFFIPYGEYPHREGLQKLDRAAADEMVAAHNSALGRLKRLMGVTYPVYIGHPDLPGSKDADKRAYGWIETMVAENEGMRFRVKWSPAGRELIENGHFKFYSPMWWLRKAGNALRPVALKSMGLTNDPNIPVPALANDAESAAATEAATDGQAAEQPTPAAPQEIAAEIRELLGLDNAADLAKVLEAIRVLKTPPANPEKEKLKTDLHAENEARKTAENELAAARDKITTTEKLLRVAVGNAVQGAVESGQVLPADAETKTAELMAANDLAAALRSLGDLPPAMKTKSVTGSLGPAKVRVVTAANDQAATRREERRVAVANEYERTNRAMPECERKRIAHERAARRNPELFSNRSPGAAA